jgi:hypothetical protein
MGDTAHYVDLAARNIQHFHPHSFMAWQAWQWTSLRNMRQAHGLLGQASALKNDASDLLRRFDVVATQTRAAIRELDAESNATRQNELESEVDRGTRLMASILSRAQTTVAAFQARRQQAIERALRAVTINGFGNHFLTDSFSAGHIVTPRADLLRDYATSLLGVSQVGGVLTCANIPSLAWHDLDNIFGVRVNSIEDQAGWTTYGDDYADRQDPNSAPTSGNTRSDTMTHVIDATKASLLQLWRTAATGELPFDLGVVLNKLPRPTFDNYPGWTADEWDRQLRWAAGEQVGADYSAIGGGQSSRRPEPGPPNEQGHQIGSGPLSARATCPNVVSFFSWDAFVIPMLPRIRREYAQRFYTGAAAQQVSPTAVPVAQPSVRGSRGSVIAGAIIGALGLGGAGALIGLALGGPIGALIGGVIGLIGGGILGGIVGGVAGRERPASEPAVEGGDTAAGVTP